MLNIATAVAAGFAILAPAVAVAQERAPSFGDPQRVAPRGSYAQSCSGSYVNQGRLYADCRDTSGRLRGTSIELSRCSNSEIGNDNGLLVCGNVRGEYERGQGGGNGGGNNGGGWGGGNGGNNGGGWGGGNGNGGWNGGNNSNITVFRDENYRGPSMTFRNEVPNLDRNANDQISSFRLRGSWEVCTDAYYRGSCTVFDYDQSNLGRSGLNDRISSLRPARRNGGGNRW